MAQTVQLKRSSVAGKVPATSDIALGEIAINTYDGKVFIKKDNGTASIVEIGAGSGGGSTDLSFSANSTVVQINSSTGADIAIGGANSTVSGFLTATTQTIGGSKTFKGPDILFDNGPGGDEGGEIKLSTATTNSTLSGPVTIDIFQNKLRIFEAGGSNRGAYIDLSAATGGVGSNLLTGGSGGSATNLTSSANGSTLSIFSDTGTDVTILGANSTIAGVLTAEAQTIAGTKTFSSTISGSITGNAGTATILQTARTINGTSFNGSTDISITANTTNTLTLGSYLTGTSFNGGTAVTAAVDATTAATAGKVVARDAAGNFSANTITASLAGNATTATALQTGRTISISGDLTYTSPSFDGSSNVTAAGTLANSGVTAGTYGSTTNVAAITVDAKGRVTSASNTAIAFPVTSVASKTGAVTLASADITDAASTSTASVLVLRDASQNFAANTITASLSGNATTATTLQTGRTINGTSFNGSANITITAANPNALTIGTGLSGTSYDGSSAVTIAIDSTVATLAGSQTLTNKTISSGILTGTLTANSGVGSSGQVLTSSGSGVYWSTVSGGGGGGATNLTLSANSTTVTVLSDTGTDAVILAANTTTAGVVTADTQTIGGAKTFANDASFSANVAITGTVTSGIWNSEVMSRVVSYTDATSITINADTTDIATMVNTQATGTFTINAPTGSLFNGQKLMFRIKSTNVQTFSWNAAFAGSVDAPLPTASSGSSLTDYLGFIYDSTATKWHVIAKNFGY